MTYFYNFGTPFISRKRVKLESSDLACRLIARGSYEINKIWVERGREGVTGDT